MAGRKRIAEKSKAIQEAVEKGEARVVKDSEGRNYIAEVKKVRRSFLENRIFYNCPKCGRVLEFKRKKHFKVCMHCAQQISFGSYDVVNTVSIRVKDRHEAYFWAERYRSLNGTTYGVDIDTWSLKERSYPAVLFFAFPDGKEYGRFMREAARDAEIVQNDI